MTETASELDYPPLDIAAIELRLSNTPEWAIVSADDKKPLTQEQARRIVVAYQVVRKLLARHREETQPAQIRVPVNTHESLISNRFNN